VGGWGRGERDEQNTNIGGSERAKERGKKSNVGKLSNSSQRPPATTEPSYLSPTSRPPKLFKNSLQKAGGQKNYLTLSGYAPTTVPVSAMAFLTDPASLNSTNANLIAELGSPQTRQSTICPAREKSAASSASVTVPSMSQT